MQIIIVYGKRILNKKCFRRKLSCFFLSIFYEAIFMAVIKFVCCKAKMGVVLLKKSKFLFAAVFAILLFSGCTGSDKTELGFKYFDPSNYSVKASVPDSNKEYEVLSTFTTKFNNSNDGRLNNIKLSSVAIDGTVLNPGEEFSFNDTVGMASKERGYEKATIFFKGEKIKEYGGGICQVSSTLYNAAIEAGLEITERHPHSMKVHYVGEDRDAATSYGSKDLKFKNNLDFPIKINTYVGEGTFTAEIIKAS